MTEPSSMTGQQELLLCDGCFEASTGELAQCEDGCTQELDHTGLCLRDSQQSCQWCGTEDRLRRVSLAGVVRLLASVGEEDQGQWYLHWQDESHGPTPPSKQPGTPGMPAAEPAPSSRSPAPAIRGPQPALAARRPAPPQLT